MGITEGLSEKMRLARISQGEPQGLASAARDHFRVFRTIMGLYEYEFSCFKT